MNLFRVREYWRYRKAAIGRHGAHSPFVYQFIDRALKPAIYHFTWPVLPYLNADGGLGVWHHSNLMRRVLRYFNFQRIAIIYAGHTGVDPALVMHKSEELESKENQRFQRASQPFDVLYDFTVTGLNDVCPKDWDRQLDAIRPGPNDIVAIHRIHQSPEHQAAWRELLGRTEVTMSIDLFETGLLFFSGDFKERQRFVLKRPV